MSDTPSESPRRPGEAPAAEPGRGSFGAWLRHQREARSVSLREIADSSKISLRYLDALEQDRFDVLPAPVFARGFLREYARVVGLNPDEVVNLFLVAVDERRGASPRAEAKSPARPRRARSSVGYGLLLALAVIAFLGVAAALSFYVERRARTAPPVENMVAPAVPAAATESPVVEESAAEPAAPGVTEPDPARSGPSTVPGGEASPLAATPAGEGRALTVVLSFAQDCWLEVSVDGRRRSSELKAGGETVSLEAEQYILLTVGNASVVTVEVNGRPFALPTSSTRVVRELRIDRAAAGLDSAGAPAVALTGNP
jgi:cytoskeletal protein RodZ